MSQNNPETVEAGDLIKVNDTVHKVSDVDGDEVTIHGIGTVLTSYLQSGMDNGKVSVI